MNLTIHSRPHDRARRLALERTGAGLLSLTLPPLARQASAQSAPPRSQLLNAALRQPWSLACLPDGRLLVTEKAGRLRMLDAQGRLIGEPLSGVPAVAEVGQGGLLDVALDPDFAREPWVYLSYSEADPDFPQRNGTAVLRARLSGNALVDAQVIFRMREKVASGLHFGSRLVFGRDKHLFVTLGERGQALQRGKSQDLSSHHGKVVRITRTGALPADNPFAGRSEVAPGVWSYGHRNVQGAAIHPGTGELWVSEHGPQGGDEINIARPGRNYGWPLVSHGCEYGSPADTCQWAGGTIRAGTESALTMWRPSVGPTALLFYTGALIPQWQGSLLMGAISSHEGGRSLWRLTLDAGAQRVLARESLYADLGERIRDVKQGLDGAVLLLTDAGRLFRLGGG